MNEIKKCSLAGVGFTFEKAAYNRLNDYLESLKKAYKGSADSEEILADIEARIVELILSAQSDVQNVVCLPLIENIIAQLGSPEDISGEEQAEQPKESRIPRRLYRDLENSKLGGVCAGLAKYFKVEAVWLRLAMASPLILLIIGAPHLHWLSILGGNLFGVIFVTYLILWFAIPSAKSARQKLEAEGEHISVQKIAKRQSATDEERAKSSVASFVGTLGRVAVIALKLMVGLMLLPLVAFVFTIVILIVALITGLYSNFTFNIGNFDTLAQAVGEVGVGMMILAFIFLLIPAIYLVYLFITLLLNKRPRWWVLILSFLLWITSFAGLAAAGIAYAEVSGEDGVLKILEYDNQSSLSRQIEEALDNELSAEEKAEIERLLYDPAAKSID